MSGLPQGRHPFGPEELDLKPQLFREVLADAHGPHGCPVGGEKPGEGDHDVSEISVLGHEVGHVVHDVVPFSNCSMAASRSLGSAKIISILWPMISSWV